MGCYHHIGLVVATLFVVAHATGGALDSGQAVALNFSPAVTLRINEFLASNVASGGLKDEDGDLSDWIEIFNDGPTAANLEGWSLTDERDDRRRWLFPSVTLGPGGFLVVFASGKDRRSTAPGARLHTNFKLGPEGEYLALLNPEPLAVSEFEPYPEQRNDYSYGYDPARQLRYFRAPTPGAANGTSSIAGVVPPPSVDAARGWFTQPFTVAVSSSLPGVAYRYTTNGSEPTAANGQDYSGPLRIANTTTLRVVGFKTDMLPSTAVTHTYLLADDLLRQPNNPPGFPAGSTVMSGYPSDYEMDPEIVNDPLYSGVVKDALLALPVLSVVLKTDDMFGAAKGIYTHPTSRGPQWERPCSVEFISIDGTKGFQVNAGIQIQGNAAREPYKQPKHPFRLVFKADYGPRALDFRLFPDAPISRFDTLVLRADFNYSWLHWNPVQRIRAQRTRDAWMKDSMRAMGGLASHNRYVHLFINGLYWGIYDPSERPDGSFGAAYLGGEKEDYDVINEGAVVDGRSSAYNAMLAISDLANPSSYARMQQSLDFPQFIDYMLLHFYAGHTDWGRNKNWYTLRPKDGRRGFLYVPWDGEMILDDPNYNRVANNDTPSDLHTKLRANAEYRLAFADRAHKHLFNNGALTPALAAARWLERARQIETAIVAESARWGDYRRDVHSYQSGPYQLYTRDNQWRTEQKRLLTQYFPRRTSVLLGQLRAARLYPNVAAPEFNQFGGRVEANFRVTLSAPTGTIYYTINGTDPRVPGSGAIAAGASPYLNPVTLSESVWIKARTLLQGVWSALAEAEFQVAEFTLPLRITEIMYHPPGGDAFEFLELQNIGSVAIDVGGFSFGGIQFVFPHGTLLAPGQTALVASEISPPAFAARYPKTNVIGYFNGSLANGGERIEWRDRSGRTITAVVYDDDSPWPAAADGGGLSLEIVDAAADPNDPANWLPSSAVDGSPGTRSVPPAPGAVRLSEVLAAADGSAGATDWIEIANTSPSPVDLSGWMLTDHSDNPPFVFPLSSIAPANAFVLVWCDGLTNAAGWHAAFRVSRQGETIGLYDADRRRVDAVSFGFQPAGFSIGRLGELGLWNLATPTPEAANRPSETAPPAQLKINEWLANPVPGEDDWIEIYNPDAIRPVALQGLFLTTDDAWFQIQSLVFVPPSGFIQLPADENAGPHHLGFKLPSADGSIRLLTADGTQIDQVFYTTQTEGVSMGRFTDGGDRIGPLTNGPTPGRSNTSSPTIRDSDHDDLPDDWETANGTNPSQPDAGEDPDNDGMTNRQEYLAGTAANDPSSNLRLHLSIANSGSVVLQFLAVSNRTYRVEYKSSVESSDWSRLTEIAAESTTRLQTAADITPGSEARFYRVVTPADR